MGLFQRPRSPFWHLWIETAPKGRQRVNTKIRVGTTVEQRKDSRRLAEERYHKLMLQAAAESHGQIGPVAKERTLRQQIAWHRDHITPHHCGAEREREILKRLDADLGQLRLSAVTRAAVLEWAARRIAKPITIRKAKRTAERTVRASASTVNREIDVLKAVLREAVPTYLTASPLLQMRRLRTTSQGARRLLDRGEERRLLKALEPDDRAIVIMGLDTLCRLSDILDLHRQDDKGATLFIRAPKSGQSYEVPVSSRLRKALDALTDADEFYFPRRRQAKTARDRRAAIRQHLAKVCKELDIPYGRAKGGITFHWATRRTGATRMIQAGVDVRTVQEIGNWKQPRVLLEIYAESNAEARQAAVELVGKRPRPTKKTA